MPHAGTVKFPAGDTITVNPIILNGTIISRSRVSVENIRPDVLGKVTYDNWQIVNRLSDFVDAYTPSSEVVLGGRAAMYFDVMGGTITASNATSISDTATETSVSGSVGSIPNRIVRSPRISASDATKPIVNPIADCNNPSPTT